MTPPIITGCEEMDYTNTAINQENGYKVIAYCICAAEKEQKRRREITTELVASYLNLWKKYVAKWKRISINNGVTTGERIGGILREAKRGYAELAKEMKAPAKAAKEKAAKKKIVKAVDAEEKKAAKPKKENAYHAYMKEVAKITKGVDMDIVISVVTESTEDIEEWDALESDQVAKKVAKIVCEIIKLHKKKVKREEIGKYVLATYTEDECIKNAFCHYFGDNEDELVESIVKLVAKKIGLDEEKEEDEEKDEEDEEKEEDEEVTDDEQEEGRDDKDKLVLPAEIENNREWVKGLTRVCFTEEPAKWKKMDVKTFIKELADLINFETYGQMKPKLAPLLVQAIFDEDKLHDWVFKKFADEEDIVGKIARKALRLASEQRSRR